MHNVRPKSAGFDITIEANLQIVTTENATLQRSLLHSPSIIVASISLNLSCYIPPPSSPPCSQTCHFLSRICSSQEMPQELHKFYV
jgi:hypothetical protein